MCRCSWSSKKLCSASVLLIFVAGFTPGCAWAEGIITTIAGGGVGDGNPATNAMLSQPVSVAIDSAGNLYIDDPDNLRVRKVDTSGVITTVAGNGTSGFSVDGVPATNTGFFYAPGGVAVNSTGNLYIIDGWRIRMVDESGVISTVAGNGAQGYAGDGGLATNAELNEPEGVAVDNAGNLYIADYASCRIRKVDISGVITTVAGNGSGVFSGDGGPATSAELNAPESVAVDSVGNLYIADFGNNRIRKVDTSGIITTVAGNGVQGYSGDGGAATAAELNDPIGVAVDSAGNIYISDFGNNRIRKVDTSGVITTLAGNGTYGFSGDGGPATSAKFDISVGLAVDSAGNLYIADEDNNRVRKVDAFGVITTVAGNGTEGYSGDGGLAINATLFEPKDVALDSAGNIFIADAGNNRIRKVATSGVITTFTGNGTQGYSGDGGLATSAELSGPCSVAVDSMGNLYIADTSNHRIRKVDTSGTITNVAGNGTEGYSGDGGLATSAELSGLCSVAVDSAGNIYIADCGNNRIRKVDISGVITTVAGNGTEGYSGDGGPAASAELSGPVGVAVDSAGNLYIADEGNNCIRQVETSGAITTVAGNGTYGFSGDGGLATNAELNEPEGVAVDNAGNLYIADYASCRIRKVDISGVITTVAGNGDCGFSGDGGLATSAEIGFLGGVAVDGAGNLYMAIYGDYFTLHKNDYRIRKVVFSGTATQVLVETAPDGSGTVVPAQTLASGSSITVYAITRDGANNFVANVAADSWSLLDQTGGVANSDLLPAGDNKSATFTGHLGGTAVIDAASGTLSRTDSGTITVAPPVAPTITSASTATATEGQAFSYQITANGSTPITFQAANLPDGLTLNSDTISGTPTVCGETAISITATNTAGSDTENLILTIAGSGTPPAPTIESQPQTTVAGQSVTLTAAASDPGVNLLNYTWNFGDSTPNGIGQTATHTYAAPGVYPATMTISNGVTYITESFEVAVGATSFTVSKGSVKFVFNKSGADSMSFTGTLPVAPGLVPSQMSLNVYIGGYASKFTLNAKGKDSNKTGSILLSGKQSKSGGYTEPPVKFTYSVKKQSLLADLQELGFSSGNASGQPVTVPIIMVLDGNGFQASYNSTYIAKQGKGGSAK
jgi:sugar lactone lactonase YvrE